MKTKTLNFYHYLKASAELYWATCKASVLHLRTHGPYFIVPDDNHKLIIVSEVRFRMLKRYGAINKKATINDLKAESFYFTPNQWKNRPGLTEAQKKYKRLAWLAYYNRNRKGA